MLTSLLLLSALLAADPTETQSALLKTFRDEFIHITPGEGEFPKSFVMGAKEGAENERPAREVTIASDFHAAKYEVPQNLWEAVMGENPSRWKGPRNSVEMLSLAEAQKFCAKATELMRAAKLIEPDEVIRLPSEAEWEYLARAGTDTAYSFGDDVGKLNDFAWHTGNAAGNDPPVGAKKPNPWGLYDMHGYLSEWCSDDWQATYEGAPVDGSPVKLEGEAKTGIVRGGSWKDAGDKLTSRYRQSLPKEVRDDAVGLRCILAKVQK